MLLLAIWWVSVALYFGVGEDLLKIRATLFVTFINYCYFNYETIVIS